MATVVYDPSTSAKLQAVQTLLDEERDLEVAQRAALLDTRDRIAQLEGQKKRLESLLAGKRGKLTEEQVRDVVKRFRGGFTTGEIAAELDEDEARVRKHIKQMVSAETVKNTGERIGGKPIFEYVAPDGAGTDFEAQQRFLSANRQQRPEVTATTPVAGTGRKVTRGLHPALADTVEAAKRAGWTLSTEGGGHFKLSKGSRMVPVPTTPRNPEAAARELWQKLQGKKQTERARIAADGKTG